MMPSSSATEKAFIGALTNGNPALVAFRECDRAWMEDGGTMYQLSDSIRCSHSQECTTILDVRRGLMFNLNTTASRVLELLQSGLEASEVAEKIELEFGVSPHAADRDV